MAQHIFSVGDLVKLQIPGFHVLDKHHVFTVMSCMPPLGQELQYRIKSNNEPYERVVTEDRLSRLAFEATAG